MTPHEGDLVNAKYRVVRQLGEGGMGSVFEAIHERLGTRVALKFLHHELASRDEVMQRFVQEARLVASIRSPHVVQVNDVEQTPDGALFMVLEYLEGRTLQRVHHDMHHEGRRLTREESLSLALQIVEGAAAAHAVGIVHRDLKPDNVMIVEGSHGEPFVKLLDFGIAKLRGPLRDAAAAGMTRPGIVMGTPEYMAPEQAFSADAVDARADVFAIGVMTFEMLAGVRPVAGDDPQILAAIHLAGDVPRLETLVPDLPAGLADVVHKAMAARTPERYASGAELLAALEPFVAAVFGPAPIVRGPADLIGQKTPVLPNNEVTKVPGSANARGPTASTNPTPQASASGTIALSASPAVVDAKTSVLPVSVSPMAGSGGARPMEPVPTTRPAQAVVFDSPSSSSASRSIGGGTVALDPGPGPERPSGAAMEVPAASTARPAKTSRRGLLIALLIAVGVVVAVCIGLYIALDEESPHTKRPTHPTSTAKKPPPPKKH